MPIPSNPATFSCNGGSPATVTFAIPAGNYTSATWDASGAMLSGPVGTVTCQTGGGANSVTLGNTPSTPSSYTFSNVAATAAQLSDINAAAGGTLTVVFTSSSPGGNNVSSFTLTLVSCSYSINPTSAAAPPAGMSGTVTVTTSSTCPWTAVSNNTAWLHVTAGASGTGSGTVSWTADANSGPARAGTITIAGQTFTVNQDTCTVGVSPASAAYDWNAHTGSLAVSANYSTCGWTAVSNASWIHITAGASGNGPGTVSYTVDANTPQGAPRTGTITAAGQTVTITQAGTPYVQVDYAAQADSPHTGQVFQGAGISFPNGYVPGVSVDSLLNHEGTVLWSSARARSGARAQIVAGVLVCSNDSGELAAGVAIDGVNILRVGG